MESGPGPLFEPTSALFRDVINGLCSYNLALLRGLFTDTTRSLPLYLSPQSRTNRARNPDRSAGNLVSSLPPFLPSLSPRSFRRLKGISRSLFDSSFNTSLFIFMQPVKFSPSLVQACTEKAITISNYGLLNFVHPCLRECSYLIIIRVINSIVGLRLGVK